jgi:hypothetical protein
MLARIKTEQNSSFTRLKKEIAIVGCMTNSTLNKILRSAMVAGSMALPMAACSEPTGVGYGEYVTREQRLFYDVCVDERLEFKVGGNMPGVDSLRIRETTDNTCAYVAFGAEPFGHRRTFIVTDIYGTGAATYNWMKNSEFAIEFWAAKDGGRSTLHRPAAGAVPADFFNQLEYHVAPSDGGNPGQNPQSFPYAFRNGVMGAIIDVPGGHKNTFTDGADGHIPFDTTKGTTCTYEVINGQRGQIDLVKCHQDIGYNPVRDYVARR